MPLIKKKKKRQGRRSHEQLRLLTMIALACRLSESANAGNYYVSVFMHSLPGSIFSGVILSTRMGAFQALHVYPFAFPNQNYNYCFYYFWCIVPNSQRIPLLHSHPTIIYHVFQSWYVNLVFVYGAWKCKCVHRFPSDDGVLQQWFSQ